MDPIVAAIDGIAPEFAADCFVAPGAIVIGEVTLGAHASVWYGCVLRGDDERIVVGRQSNIQDGSIIHADAGQPTILADRVSLGHGAIVHGAAVEDDVLVGIRATVLNGTRVGAGSIIAAGAVLRPGTTVPPRSLVVGVPGDVRRTVTDTERDMISKITRDYVRKMALHQRNRT